jgi:hypothetical protein
MLRSTLRNIVCDLHNDVRLLVVLWVALADHRGRYRRQEAPLLSQVDIVRHQHAFAAYSWRSQLAIPVAVNCRREGVLKPA